MSRQAKSANKGMNFSIRKILFKRTNYNLLNKGIYINNSKNKRNQCKFPTLKKYSTSHTMWISRFCSLLNNYTGFILHNWKCNNRALKLKNVSRDKSNWHCAIRPSKAESINCNKLKETSFIKLVAWKIWWKRRMIRTVI